ncbi:MAG: hypothetical protein R3348_09740 [Xanthomonadales bacterium]|nr:hypothetical protein [Xanthomonadales bacterium]
MTTGRTTFPGSALSQAGLDQDGFQSKHLSIHEITTRAIIRLRRLPVREVAARHQDRLPELTGQCKGTDPKLLCLRPGEWLVMSIESSRDDLWRHVQDAWADKTHIAFDESDGLAILRVDGSAAAWLIAKHCSLDTAQLNQGEEGCAQTRLGRISVLVHYCMNGELNQYALIVERSLVRYVWELLASGIPHAVELADRFGI